MSEVALLTEETVGSYVRARGLTPTGEAPEALGGGVSNVVLAVPVSEGRVVVKQALPALRVADEWLAKRERALTEAEALRLAARFTPDAVPAVRDVDPETCSLIIDGAPPSWATWKEHLLRGDADTGVAGRLGALLASWHAGTARDPDATARIDDAEAFEQLRIEPYHETVMRRRPEVASFIGPFVEQMRASRTCLVHGDFSPKNILVEPRASGRLWVIDFEVAHLGDPAFDLAFLLNHLMLKAIHVRDAAPRFAACTDAFLAAYRAAVPAALQPDPRYVLGHMACLMLARVDGKSPAEYLTDPGRAVARALGDRILTESPDGLDAAWKLYDEETTR